MGVTLVKYEHLEQRNERTKFMSQLEDLASSMEASGRRGRKGGKKAAGF